MRQNAMPAKTYRFNCISPCLCASVVKKSGSHVLSKLSGSRCIAAKLVSLDLYFCISPCLCASVVKNPSAVLSLKHYIRGADDPRLHYRG